MNAKMTSNMEELQWQVVTWAYCPWETFLENVEQEMEEDEFASLVEKCETEKDFRKLIGRFV